MSGDGIKSDGINSRLTLDYESTCADIERILDDIGRMCTDKYFIKALGEKTVGNIRAGEEVIGKRLHGAFQLVVIGDFKRGKSTLINALLGEAVVPTAVTPETVTINRLSFSDTPRIEAILKNRKRVSLSQPELTREVLDELIGQLPAPIESIDIRLNHEYLRDITIVDTPGMGDLMKAFNEQVADYLVNADAIIYVVSARSPLSYMEQAFLSTSIMPQSFSRVFLAVNMADTLETEENLHKIKELVENRAGAVSEKIYVYLLSALDEFCRKRELNRPEPGLAEALENNFLEFESALQNDVILQKDIIKSTRGIALTRLLLRDITFRISLVKNTLNDNIEKLEQRESVYQEQDTALRASIEKHKETLSTNIHEMTIEAKVWMRAFLERLKEEIGQIGSTADVGDLQRYFQFYLMDHIKSAVLACTQRHQKEIDDLLLDSAKAISGEISQNAFGNIQSRISDCIADISWTNIDTAMFAGDVILSMSGLTAAVGPLILIGQAIAGAARQKTMAKKQADVIAPVLQAFPSVVSGVLENIDTIYAQIAKNAMIKLDEIYQNQIEVSEEAMKHAQRIASDESIKVQDVLEFLDETMQTVHGYMECLKEYE